MFRLFRIPIIVNAIALVASYFIWGFSGALTVAILSILEISFSFDNAVVNAKILGRMNELWQRLFLTVGILIAVFGMRLLFPLIVVAISAKINPLAALHLAIQHPTLYAHDLTHAHSAIAAFGGTFLLMLFLDWLKEDKEVFWLKPIEQFFYRIREMDRLPLIITLMVLALIHAPLLPAILGLATYIAVSSLDIFFSEDNVMRVARAGLATFLYLEVLDASFSFDGVIGAFAVSTNIFLIAIGLGIGATYIRNLTVYLVRRGVLSEYIYLEHGAHWAIGSLAALLLLTIKYNVPDVITGLIGVAFIGTAYVHSIMENRK